MITCSHVTTQNLPLTPDTKRPTIIFLSCTQFPPENRGPQPLIFNHELLISHAMNLFSSPIETIFLTFVKDLLTTKANGFV